MSFSQARAVADDNFDDDDNINNNNNNNNNHNHNHDDVEHSVEQSNNKENDNDNDDYEQSLDDFDINGDAQCPDKNEDTCSLTAIQMKGSPNIFMSMQ
jgi:hypothetical protein